MGWTNPTPLTLDARFSVLEAFGESCRASLVGRVLSGESCRASLVMGSNLSSYLAESSSPYPGWCKPLIWAAFLTLLLPTQTEEPRFLQRFESMTKRIVNRLNRNSMILRRQPSWNWASNGGATLIDIGRAIMRYPTSFIQSDCFPIVARVISAGKRVGGSSTGMQKRASGWKPRTRAISLRFQLMSFSTGFRT
ncbi:hypothetical protein Poly41_06670 [Novipirellula artificiosorum]|uniref:Uncharacterized protein n=1 Tax=Novipirellula artificiosorum TaxID=2528016 RepID=A0A5C6E0I6_9BACT|nr:hypothetical protein Poly41_06670 [Novipirellula artificiosorum]